VSGYILSVFPRIALRALSILFLPLLVISCTNNRSGVIPPPLVMLWDKVSADAKAGQDDSLRLTLFFHDGTIDELSFAPQWSADAYIDYRSGLAAFNGGKEPLSLDETLRCYGIASGKEKFAKTDGDWVPLGFIEDGKTLVAMKREAVFRLLHGNEAEGELEGFTGTGYRLKYTLYLINGLTGATGEGRVIYDAASETIRWEDRVDFMPKLACDAGLLLVALPEFPYVTGKIDEDKRPVKLWALDVHGGEARAIDLGNSIRDRNFSYIVSGDGGSIFFQSQRKDETVSLNLPYYGDTPREWGSLYIWRNGEIKPIAPLDGKHVKHQMGLSGNGDVLLYVGIEYDRGKRCPKEGTLSFYLNHPSGLGERKLPISGDVWNVSLSPCGGFVGYMVSKRDGLQLRVLDTANMKDAMLARCGAYSRFYGFAGAGRGDIAIPRLDSMLFGYQETTTKF